MRQQIICPHVPHEEEEVDKTERILYEKEMTILEEEKECLYSVTYYDNNDVQHGKMCDSFDGMIDFVDTLRGFRHINILRFKRSEL